MLPKIPYKMEKNKSQSIPMRSINLGSAAEVGELSDSLGISTRKFPYLTVRRGDSKLDGYEGVKAMTVFGGEPVTVQESGIYVGSDKIEGISWDKKHFAPINSKLVVFPDKKYIENRIAKNMEAETEGDANNVTFSPNSIRITAGKEGISGYGGSLNKNVFSAGIEFDSIIRGTYLFCTNAQKEAFIASASYAATGTIKKDSDGKILFKCTPSHVISDEYSRCFIGDDFVYLASNFEVETVEIGIGYGYTLTQCRVVAEHDTTYGNADLEAIETERECSMYFLRTGGSNFLSYSRNDRYVEIVNGESVVLSGIVKYLGIGYMRLTKATMTPPDGIFTSDAFRIRHYGWNVNDVESISPGAQISFENNKAEIYAVDSTEIDAARRSFTLTLTFADGAAEDFSISASKRHVMYIHTADENIFSSFKKGDAVEISGSSFVIDEEQVNNDISFIIDKIKGNTLFAASDIFTEGVSTTEVTVKRRIPDLDFICEKDNRLYGVCNADKTIYVSALGDPTNMYTYEGFSTDSFALAVGGEGDFTGCCKYGEAVLFFKEDMLYKLVGSSPLDFALYSYNVDGIERGSEKSCVVINEVLYYKGRQGVYAYTGGVPVLISECFGERRFSGGVGGTDGRYYYLSVIDEEEKPYLFTYDTRTQLWLIEEKVRCVDFARTKEGLRYVGEDGCVYAVGSGQPSGEWLARWAPIYEIIDGKRCYSRILVRVSLPRGSYIIIKIRCDGREWREAGKIVGKTEAVVPIRIPINRCDKFELELSGRGECTILNILREYYVGSEV